MAPKYSEACIEAVTELLRDGGSLTAYRANPKFGVGPREGSWAWRLEREIEKRFRVRNAIVVSSGTAALYCALRSLALRPGDEVITSPITFSATAAAIILSGGIPVFADVHPDTGCITPAEVSRVITKRVKAVMPVHLFGQVVPMQEFQALNLPIVEDACQAAGSIPEHTFDWLDSIQAYSFCAVKQIPSGEGGCLTTSSPEASKRVREIINHGENFDSLWPGWNFRMNEPTACIAYHGLLDLKPNTPYAVIDPEGVPYLDKHLGHYPAFQKYMRGPLPGADEFLRKTRIRYV